MMKVKLILASCLGLATLALVSCSDADLYGYGGSYNSGYGGGYYEPYQSYRSYGSPALSTTFIYSSGYRTSGYPYQYRGRYYHDHASALQSYRYPSRHYDYHTRRHYGSSHSYRPYGSNHSYNHRDVVNHRGRHDDRYRYQQSPIVQRQTRPGHVSPHLASTRANYYRNRGPVSPNITQARAEYYRNRGAVSPSVNAKREEYYRNRGAVSPSLNNSRAEYYRNRQNASPQRQNLQPQPDSRPRLHTEPHQAPVIPRSRPSHAVNNPNLVSIRNRMQNAAPSNSARHNEPRTRGHGH